MPAGDSDDVGRGPGEWIGPGVLWYSGTVEGEDELSSFSEVCDCGGLMDGWRGIE